MPAPSLVFLPYGSTSGRTSPFSIWRVLSLLRVPLLPAQLDPSKDALIHDAGTIAGFLALREYERADIAFRDLLKKYPSTPFAHYAYGAMLAGRGQEEAAEAQFQE